MEQGRARGGTTGTLASAPRRTGLRQWRCRRLVDLLELLGHARRREPEPGPWARTEAHRAELAGVLVDPGACLAVQSGDLGSINKRFALGVPGGKAAQSHSESIRDPVGQSIERVVVVVLGLLSAGLGGCGGDAGRHTSV